MRREFDPVYLSLTQGSDGLLSLSNREPVTMKNALRPKLAPLEQMPDAHDLSVLVRTPGVSPVHALQDRLVSHFNVEQHAAAGVLARPVRMVLIFWSAVAAWAITGMAIYLAVSLVAK
jgi:hypothetical protein